MNETNVDLSALPEGWMETTLGEICESALKTQPKDHPEVEFTYIDIASIDNHLSKVVNPKIYAGKDAPSRARQVVRTGDILFSTVRTYLKNIALVNDRYDGQIASTGFCIIRPLIASTEFIFWMTLSNDFLSPLNKIQRGTSYPAVRDSDVFSQTVPLPPENEQIRIVAKIEELFTKLDAGKEELLQAKARLKRYRQSVLKAAMDGELTEDWRKKHGGEIEPASVLLKRILKERREKWEAEQLEQMKAKGKAPKDDKWKNKYKEPQIPDTSKLPELPEGWVWTTLEKIIEPSKEKVNPLEIKEVPYISLEHIQKDTGKLLGHGSSIDVRSSKTKFTRGDLLYGKLRPYLNKVHISDFEGVCSTDLLVFPKNELLSNMFFLYRFLCRDFVNYASHNVSGVNLPRVNFQTLSQFEILLPPLPEQHRIVSEVERRLSVADAVEATIDNELKRSDALRQSILKQAFSGKLVPQDPNDEPASVLLERIKEDKMKRETEQKSSKRKKTKKRKQGLTKIDNLLSEKTRNTRIYDALKSVGQPLPSDELLELSRLDVDEFYAQLKAEVESGKIIERRPNKTAVFLEIKNET